MTSLFRAEAIEAKRDSWLGPVQIAQPLPVRIVSWSCLALLVLALGMLGLCSYTRHVHAVGEVAPSSGVLTLSAAQPGTIVTINAKEGQLVHKDEVLFVETLENTSVTGPTQKQIVAHLGRQRDLLVSQRRLRLESAPSERQSLAADLRYAVRQRDRVMNELANDNSLIPVIGKILEQTDRARALRLATEGEYQGQLLSYSQLLGNRSHAEQTRLDTEDKIATLVSKLKRFDNDLQHDLNELDRQIAIIDQSVAESEGHRTNVIVAPKNGVLTGLRVYAGMQINPGTELVSLLPPNQALSIDLFADSSSIGFIQKGQVVLLRYAAYPYQKFGLHRGIVSEITRAPISSAGSGRNEGVQREEASAQRQGALYRVRVRPDEMSVMAYGIAHPLEAGMTVEADIGTDRRRLWQWLLDPIQTIGTSLASTDIH